MLVRININSDKFSPEQVEEIKKGVKPCLACFRGKIKVDESMKMLFDWAEQLKGKYNQKEIEEMVSEAQKAAEENFYGERID